MLHSSKKTSVKTFVNMMGKNLSSMVARMDEMHDRLKHARETAGFRFAKHAFSAIEAENPAAKLTTYRAHENGQNKFKLDDAKLYGRVFHCDPQWLLTGNGAAPTSSAPETSNDQPFEPQEITGGIDFDILDQATKAADMLIADFKGDVSLERRHRMITAQYLSLLELQSRKKAANG